MIKSHLIHTSIGHVDPKSEPILGKLEKDPALMSHGIRVSKFAVTIAKRLAVPQDYQEQIRAVGLLHDVGKLELSEELLSKKNLTSDEWERIKAHSAIGKNLLEQSPHFSKVIKGVFHHHERIDGTGYPMGIKGTEIPLDARIVCVADSLDAMISQRPYRERSFTFVEALYQIKSLSGKVYDPEIVKALDSLAKDNMTEILKCLL